MFADEVSRVSDSTFLVIHKYLFYHALKWSALAPGHGEQIGELGDRSRRRLL